MKKLLVPFALALALAACQQETPPTQPPLPKTDGATPGGSLPERTQAGIDTLDKAKEVEGAARQQAAEQEKAINRQTQ